MRLPKKPPEWRDIILNAGKAEKMPEIFEAGQEEAMRNERYLHWDEFRHKPSKGTLNVEENWAGVKLSRSYQRQAIPLNDAKGQPFNFSITQGMFESLHDIDLHCGGVVSVPSDIANFGEKDRYYVSSLMEEALTSSQLEGAVVTRAEAKNLLRKQTKPATKHERMVLNNFLTMRAISELADKPLTPEILMKIHALVTKGTLEDVTEEGRLRNESEFVRIEDEESGEVMHIPPPAEQLEKRVQQFCDFANGQSMKGYLHPVIRAILLHFWVAYDHPFVDGNGRTARALFYWCMVRNGFWLFEFISISHVILKAPKKYYRAFLHTESDDNDLNYFILHQLQVITASIRLLHDYIDRKKSELAELKGLLGVNNGLNHRQIALLKNAIKHRGDYYTVESHRVSHNVAIQTSRTDLYDLVSRGVLVKFKVGIAWHFQAAPDLTTRLKNLGPR